MLRIGPDLQFSATDLVGHLNCGHLTALDLQVADGALEKPKIWDPLLEILQQRGAVHEAAYIEHLEASGLAITVVEGKGVDDAAVAATIAAMKAGAPIIVQAALRTAPFSGRADILRRIEEPSDLGAWSYEVIDTKLARETKGGTVLQLCLYADLVGDIQGRAPEFAYVVTPLSDFAPERFRVSDYAAYYRNVRDRFAASVDGDSDTYPEPVAHCDICRWRGRCNDQRHQDDHLSLVAGITAVQRGELASHDVTTMTALAALPLPLPWKPERGAAASYHRMREQARIQVDGRAGGHLLHEPLPVELGFGLCRLPEPDDGDIFFDLEGDPFVGEGGLEYLFGYAFKGTDGTLTYVADWCFTPADEKAAFERFVDIVMERRQLHPGLHIYHYAPYEPGALKRLMGRYATREEEIDALLRGQVMVDLYSVVRHAIRASVESYSIKKLEPLYAFTRAVPLPDANYALSKVQACLELGDTGGIGADDQAVVAGYNQDDCVSTARLRDWLENLRTSALASGVDIPRPSPPEEAAPPDVTVWQARIDAVVARLTEGIPVDPAERSAEQQALYVLANVLDWHRREAKAIWWEYFRLAALSAEDLESERAGIAGLTFVDTVGGTVKAPIHRYRFPPQDAEFRGGEDLRSAGGERFGKVEAVDLEHRFIDIKKRGDTAAFHPEAIFAHTYIDTGVLAESLVQIGEYVADHGITGRGRYKAARDLLLRLAPDVGAVPLQQPDESAVDAACRLVRALQGVLAIQGPPGAGKTHTGAHAILALVKAGLRVGVTANSHKVIRNLLEKAAEEAEKEGFDLHCLHKVMDPVDNVPHITATTKNPDALNAFASGHHVLGGTGFLWARSDAAGLVDVLFVDEAAQMSLANVLAISPAANNLVLLGDPQQLEQPMQGSHPEGTDVSALDHLLGGRQTIAEDEGLFLDQTWRLHPDICRFTSELFYEGRLLPRPGLENQTFLIDGPLGGAGLRYVAVHHSGNQNCSPEEAIRIRDLVNGILDSGARWRDREGSESPLTLNDILIIAPYNAQVFEIQERLPGARVGTVDKFQGQEAPIVIYSVTTSTHADAPRGMEFLYSANRLNVATSRAKILCILVANPDVFEPDCRTPRQMQLANGFCRYLEMADAVK
ncbi:TM0106 family RecB-like putative nuclease (plasmid) [Ensifer adhaerens]|uniref:TM0106 family RecB-like putative nuclease n=1 Tax=Ensifer adhaerens TaxID=106592 RepID=UPI0023A974D0|nr:TM0106 family RecB-like putative nuclease [Ensifer adhaerens]WDZ82065.1 TM0106 family RecB-like putative nuclease [Ensifer adhaerens]